MKTPEEIEQLAEKWYNKQGKLSPSIVEKRAFKEGYTQCQTTELKEALEEIERVTQDFIKAHETIEKLLDEKINLSVEIERLKGEKKYTEQDLRDEMEESMAYNKLRQITEYLQSLNKQQDDQIKD